MFEENQQPAIQTKKVTAKVKKGFYTNKQEVGFFLYEVAQNFVEKIRQRAALFWSGLQVVGFLQTFYSRAVIQRTIGDSPTFLKHGSAEKIAVCAHTTHDLNK